MTPLQIASLFIVIGSPAGAFAPRVEPRAVSVHPFVGQRGTTFTAVVRGNGLRGASSVFLQDAPLAIAIEATEAEPPAESGGRSKTPFDRVRMRVEVARDARIGRYPFRIVTPQGISNALVLDVTEHAVVAEPDGPHDDPETAIAVARIPAVYAGRIARRGETDYYALEAKAGETLTFEAISGLPSIGAPGGNAQGFDPKLQVFEQSGSWFDSKRWNRIAANDEPLWVIGRLTDAHLAHRFARSGRYLLRIEAFSGQGGPDYGYQLRIVPGDAPLSTPAATASWEERSYSRRLSADRLAELAVRGGKLASEKPIPSYPAAPDSANARLRVAGPSAAPSPEPPVLSIPAALEGTISSAGEARRARFRVDSPVDIAIEIEAPAAAPPLFNPIVRLLDAAGAEVATNIFAGRGACTGALTKSQQVKTLVALRDAGEYTIEVRDATSDLGGADFCFRVLIRPQVPHVGNVRIEEDRVNLAPGEAKTVRVAFDREEDFRGAVAVAAESLPAGVSLVAGADYEPDKDSPPARANRERYVPRNERAVVVFTASPDAPPTRAPQVVRLVVRPVVDGKTGAILAAREIPIVVIAEP
jgi:hypothetical protein